MASTSAHRTPLVVKQSVLTDMRTISQQRNHISVDKLVAEFLGVREALLVEKLPASGVSGHYRWPGTETQMELVVPLVLFDDLVKRATSNGKPFTRSLEEMLEKGVEEAKRKIADAKALERLDN